MQKETQYCKHHAKLNSTTGMTRQQNRSAICRFLIALLLLQSSLMAQAFMVVVPPTNNHIRSTIAPLSTKFHSPSPHHRHAIATRRSSSTQQLLVPEFQSLMLATLEEGLAVEDPTAFTDTVDLFGDELIQTMVGVFGVVMVVLVGFKVLADKMDSAIEKVVLDFESTMKTRYPSRWESIEEKLTTTNSAERTQQIMDIMEQLQKEDPEFMEQINKQML